MSKVTKLAASLAVFPVLAFSAPVFADSPGDLAGGADIYQVRNVTQNSNYGSSAATACSDTVKYSVKLSNTDYSTLTNVTVKASLTSGQMNASATKADNTTTTTTGTVNVSLPTNGTLNYVAGSTKLYDVNGTLIKSLSDGVTAAGVNAGDLNGSTREFLQFQATVNCPPVTPPTTNIQVCRLSDKKIVTIKDTEFDSAKYTKDLTKCNATTTPPTTLVNTGPGQVAAIFAAAAAFGVVAYNVVLRRQNAR